MAIIMKIFEDGVTALAQRHSTNAVNHNDFEF